MLELSMLSTALRAKKEIASLGCDVTCNTVSASRRGNDDDDNNDITKSKKCLSYFANPTHIAPRENSEEKSDQSGTQRLDGRDKRRCLTLLLARQKPS